MKSKKISVIGLGYIGLPTAAVLSNAGFHVRGVDINQDIVDIVNNGDIHIIEPGLSELIAKSVKAGSLVASTEVQKSDIFVIAVPTPFKGTNHAPDLSYIKKAAQNISSVLKQGDLVILESTSPVGTTEQLKKWLLQGDSKELNIHIAYCPERVMPGNIMNELIENDRVIGGMDKASSELSECFYKQFITGQCHITNARTAEMSKLVENSYRDVNIAFANEISAIAVNSDINVWELIQLTNKHPRVNVLSPGPGVGGHCIAVDPWFIIDQNPNNSRLLQQSREINDSKPKLVIEDILKLHSSQLSNSNIALFGISYKANSDDLRSSPSLKIANELSKKLPSQVFVVEPNIHNSNAANLDNLNLISLETAIDSCALIVLLVSHKEFKSITSLLSSSHHVYDCCGLASQNLSQ